MNIAILKNSIILLLSQNIQFYLHFITNRFNSHEKDTQKRKKMTLHYSDSELHEEYLKNYFDECKALPNAKRRELGNRYDSIKFFLKHIIVKSCLKMRIEWQNNTKWYTIHATTRRWWRSKRRKRIKNFNPKKAINQTSNIISTNKSMI